MSLNRNRDQLQADGIERLRGTGLGRGMHRNICFCQENQEMDGAWDHRLKALFLFYTRFGSSPLVD